MDQPRRGHSTTQRITLVRTPSPPRNYSDFEDELKIHQLVGIPEVNLSDYCKQRFQLIEGYNSNIKELQKFYNEQVIEEYWKFKFQHLKLSAQHDFNTKVNQWKSTSGKPATMEVSTQTEVQEKDALQVIEKELTVVPATTVPQPSTSAIEKSSGFIFQHFPHQAKQQQQQQLQPEKINNTAESNNKLERIQRKRNWKQENPNWSYPYSPFTSSGSDTEPLPE